MQALYLLILTLPPQAPAPPQAPDVRLWTSPIYYPPGMEEYTAATETQEIAVTNGRDRVSRVQIRRLESKWRQSGGMEGVRGWRSQKFRFLPRPVRTSVGRVRVKFMSGGREHTQENWGLKRVYPNGTRFDDVLSNDEGQVFEHRRRYKDSDGDWQSEVIYEDPDARPVGYHGLDISCASCHDKAGTGEYAAPLVQGGDTVLSDPLDWTAWEGSPKRMDPEIVTDQPQAPEIRQSWPSYSAPSSPRRGPIFRGRRGGSGGGG